MRVETRLRAYRDRVDSRLEELLPLENQEPKQLHAAMRYSCLAPGKRLRPALCLASAEAVGPEAHTGVLDGACAIEMVHCFSLIHDDLPAIDDDSLRRGTATCHVKYGEAIALLAGDALFSRAFEVLSEAKGEPERVLLALQLLSRATGSNGLVGGEVLDVLAEGADVDAKSLQEIHLRKTGALIAASCEIGSLLAGATNEQRRALGTFGIKVGLAFQIVDDVLNETSTAEQLGKAAGSDRKRQKATYPRLHGLDGAREEASRLLNSAAEDLSLAGIASVALGDLAQYAVERLH